MSGALAVVILLAFFEGLRRFLPWARREQRRGLFFGGLVVLGVVLVIIIGLLTRDVPRL